MKVERSALSADFRRSVATNLEIGRARDRRRALSFPLRNRWLVVKLRWRTAIGSMWQDLVYLVKG